MTLISATIICFNEEKKIRKCIESLHQICGEIIVVDSYSTDKTLDILSEYSKVKVHQQKWLGFSAQKQLAVDLASNDWILSLDSDEYLSPELSEEITSLKKSLNENTCYTVPRLNYYCGKWMKGGGLYPDRQLRLFHRKNAKWSTSKVHEKIIVNSNTKIQKLKSDLMHHSIEDKEQHIKDIERYSSLAAIDLSKKDIRFYLLHGCFHAFSRFTGKYIFKLGFLDGLQGLQHCSLSAWAAYLKYIKASKIK